MLKLTTLTLILTLASSHPGGKAASSPAIEDVDLARSAVSDPEAFSELYHRYLNGVYRYHLTRTGHVQEAEDVTAQTFLTTLESIQSFRGQGSFSSWLFGIASHKLADHYRRSRIELPLEEAENLHSPVPLPEVATQQHLELARVARVLHLISPERAEALVLCLFGGLSLAETAQVVGKSEAAVKMLVHRGLCGLQEPRGISTIQVALIWSTGHMSRWLPIHRKLAKKAGNSCLFGKYLSQIDYKRYIFP
jgi:RNA polymerase sigma-70 factor (ECF subfamily)